MEIKQGNFDQMIGALRHLLGTADPVAGEYKEPSLLQDVPSITTYGSGSPTVVDDAKLARSIIRDR